MNDIADAGVIAQNSLSDMIEKLHEVIIFPRANIEEVNFQIGQPPFACELALDFSNFRDQSFFGKPGY